jgi:hypothetical protein
MAGVPPVDLADRSQLDVVEGPPGTEALVVDQLGLVEADGRLGRALS